MSARLLLVLPLAAAALAAGCGGDDENATEAWAGDVCSAISTWTDSLKTTASSLTGSGLSQNGLQTAVADLKAATSTLADDLKALGPPETDSGSQAKEELDQLATKVEQNAETIQTAAADVSGPSDLVTAVTTISTTLSAMGNEVASAFDSLQKLDAKGELEDAFSNASSCDDLTSSSS